MNDKLLTLWIQSARKQLQETEFLKEEDKSWTKALLNDLEECMK